MFEELWRDDRAIEGLPIRLVIALVVGVASLSVMMNILSGLGTFGVTELDVAPEPELVEEGEETDLTMTVVDPDGEPVTGATLVVSGATATLTGGKTAETGSEGTAEVTIEPSLGPNQDQGEVKIQIKPPASGGYVDRRSNTDVLVTSA